MSKWKDARSFAEAFSLSTVECNLRTLAWVFFLNEQQKQDIRDQHEARMASDPQYKETVETTKRIWDLKAQRDQIRRRTWAARWETAKIKTDTAMIRIGNIFFPK